MVKRTGEDTIGNPCDGESAATHAAPPSVKTLAARCRPHPTPARERRRCAFALTGTHATWWAPIGGEDDTPVRPLCESQGAGARISSGSALRPRPDGSRRVRGGGVDRV